MTVIPVDWIPIISGFFRGSFRVLSGHSRALEGRMWGELVGCPGASALGETTGIGHLR